MTTELPSGIGLVIPFANERDWATFIRVVKVASGIVPTGRRDTEGVQRALYPEARSRAILNCSSSKIRERLGNPSVVVTLVVDDPRTAAELAVRTFIDHGYKAMMLDSAKAEIGLPENFMYFALPRALPALLFWPKKPDPEMLRHVPVPTPWKEPD